MLIQEENNRILGAHVFGPHVDDVINLFALAIRLGARASEVGNVLYAYPSVVTSENVGRFDSSFGPGSVIREAKAQAGLIQEVEYLYFLRGEAQPTSFMTEGRRVAWPGR